MARAKTRAVEPNHGNLVLFPDNCCHHASILFAIHLVETAREDSTVVWAKRGRERDRHVWVEWNDLVIDLMCGQFHEDAMPDYYVGPRREWHDSWKRVDRDTEIIDYERANRYLSGWYQRPYELVVAVLDLSR